MKFPKITDNITWVGKIDWELETFHGEDFSTHHGSSYNSFLIEDEKIVLLDTVWTPYAKEFVDNLAQTIDLKRIDAIVIHHGEPDHSGALPELMKHIPDTPIYCSPNGIKSLRGQYHCNWNLNVVKTGDRLSLGKNELIFTEMTMLHWPDSMLSYLTGQNILFSNDSFGQHFASLPLYNDATDEAILWQEAIKYYANILQPYNMPLRKKLPEILSSYPKIDMICPSHGIIWRKNPMQIVEKYQKWCANYSENQITIIYDSMWGTTRQMAEAIGQGVGDVDQNITIKLLSSANFDNSDICTEVFKSKAVAVGSSTINNGLLSPVAATLKELYGLKFKGKKAAAFGSYGWSGEGPKEVAEGLEKAGFEMIAEPLRQQWMPTEKDLEACRELGRNLALAIEVK